MSVTDWNVQEVPAMIPGSVKNALWVASSSEAEAPTIPAFLLASPKSRIRAKVAWARTTFSGLMSRCTKPFWWAAERPSAIWAAISADSVGGIGPRFKRARSVSPATYSETAYRTPSCSPTSKSGTTFGCESAATARASFSKRRTLSGSPAWAAVRILTATSRWSRVSKARKTSPIPPAPTDATISYGPRREPGPRGPPCLRAIGG